MASSTPTIKYRGYESEDQLLELKSLMDLDLSEPYTVYTYRYFLNNWSKLCFLAYSDIGECIGAIVCKLESNKGYIAMLAVKDEYRRHKIGSKLVRLAIESMRDSEAEEIVLETETTNNSALGLYENLGFVRDKRLSRYYLNGLDALRLKLWLR